MSDNTTNFALPGLMAISRPRLDRQRAPITLPIKRLAHTLWPGIVSVGPITPGGVAPPYPLALVRMIFRLDADPASPEAFACSSAPATGEGFVSLTHPTTWLFSVPAQPLPLPLGNYFWELHTRDSAGNNYVYYSGTQLIAP